MIESRMSSAWIDQASHRELIKASKPLENRRINDVPLFRVSIDAAVNRIPNFKP